MKNKLGSFDEEDLQKAYTTKQDKYDETVTIASRSHQIGRKLQSQTKTEPPPGLNIAPNYYPSTTSGLTQEDVEDEDISILEKASLDLDPS